ncbi:MAG: ABC transporter ATP-binding protein [Desulfobacterales bacterium]|jgi:oligopeptide/dipeptide ABC transporter ATP-binding protein
MSKLVEIVDLVTNFYTYEGVVRALNRISLTIDHGVTLGLVGESGCGKSVLVRSLMRIIQEPGRIDGGRILFYPDSDADSVDLAQQSDEYMRGLRGNQISMIFQEPNAALNPIMSIGDQIAESFLIHRRHELGRDAATISALTPIRSISRLRKKALGRVVSLLEQLGIANAKEIVHRFPHELSGGMKQRILIAIALACRPMLLIADEATSNLDVTIQAQILELLLELKKTQISSVLLITHDLGVVAETCQRVGVMYAGNLCEVADVQELFSNPRHPYTKALLAAVPKFSQEGELKSIGGNVPNLVTPPSGCRFHPRCPQAKPICRERFPADIELGSKHTIACYLYTDQPRASAP